jgi:hypothetical protein
LAFATSFAFPLSLFLSFEKLFMVQVASAHIEGGVFIEESLSGKR